MPVDSRDVEALFGSLRILFDDNTVGDMVQIAAGAVGVQAIDRLGDIYPPPSPDGSEPSHIRTDKQRRWWWASMHAIAKGEPVAESLRGWKASYKRIAGRKTLVIAPGSGYKRTGTLVRSIDYDVRRTGQGVEIGIGPSMAREGGMYAEAEYAQFVLDEPPPDGKQARIHEGRWLPIKTAIAGMSNDLLDTFEETLIEEVRRRMKGRGYSYAGSAVK